MGQQWLSALGAYDVFPYKCVPCNTVGISLALAHVSANVQVKLLVKSFTAT